MQTSNRTYKKTHPWIIFSIDLRDSSPLLWTLLGECKSKCEHIANVPLRPQTARELYRIYLAKGALATTAIEGNTLTEEEVLKHLSGELKLPKSRVYLAKEIDNIVDGCKKIFQVIANQAIAYDEMPEVSVKQIKEINRIVLDGLELEEGVILGEIRQHPVFVGKSYRGAPERDCEHLLQQLCEWLNSEVFSPAQESLIEYAILKAIIAHVYIAWIHPFGDGNGRTARLLEFFILISAGVPAVSAHLMSNHYNLTRTEYYRQLNYSSKSKGDIKQFITYAVQGFRDGLEQQIKVIWQQQWDIAWRDYVQDFFGDKISVSNTRRQHLVLDLSLQKEPVPLEKLNEISLRLAIDYKNKTQKTISRDIKALIKVGLVEKTTKGYRACREIILAFLPQRAKVDLKN